MGVNSPKEMPETFGKLFNARDREGLLDGNVPPTVEIRSAGIAG